MVSLSVCKASCDKRKRKKPGFRRHALPKYLKKDIRLSYASMLINTMNSKDVYQVYAFLSCFSTNCINVITVYHDGVTAETGSIAFVKHWYLHTLGSPDLVYHMANRKVIVFVDGSSEITFDISMLGNFLYCVPKIGIGEKDVNEMMMPSPTVQQSLVLEKLGKLIETGPSGVSNNPTFDENCEEDLLDTMHVQQPLGSLKDPFKMYCKGLIRMRLTREGHIHSMLCALTESITEKVLLSNLVN